MTIDQIPHGSYCYKINNINQDGVQKVEYCPYFTFLENGFVKCKLMDLTSEDDILLDDQVKICGISEETYSKIVEVKNINHF